MLPTPASYRPSYRRNPLGLGVTAIGSHGGRRLLDTLRLRARLTNLAVLLLVGLCTVSLLFNLLHFVSYPSPAHRPSGQPGPFNQKVTPADRRILDSLLSSVPREDAVAHSDWNHLVIVPGHAVWKGSDPYKRLDEKEWILEPYQKGTGRLAAFFNHIAKAAELTLHDENAVVVFSGGQTRPTSTTTEGQSYLRLALLSGVFGEPGKPFPRATTEDYALDSFQNLLFSITRFHELTGRYPSKITVVGYEMKRKRFVELHRKALRWPLDKFHYIGIDAEGEEATHAHVGELRNGYTPYSQDMYGCHTTLLSKRRQRNPWLRFHPYFSTNLELRSLLDWCPSSMQGGGTVIYPGILPWDPS